jgi:hypothetical protein
MKALGSDSLLAAAIFLLLAGPAKADLAPPSVGLESQPLFLVAAGALVVLVLWLLIRGALSLPQNKDPDDDHGGVGLLEGIDEDDDERKKKR